jgi:hypothetical protein
MRDQICVTSTGRLSTKAVTMIMSTERHPMKPVKPVKPVKRLCTFGTVAILIFGAWILGDPAHEGL